MSYNISGPGDYCTAPYLAQERRAEREQRERENILSDNGRLREAVWEFLGSSDKAMQVVVRHIVENIDVSDKESELARELSEFIDDMVVQILDEYHD